MFGESLVNRVPCEPACQRGLRANVLACQRRLYGNVPKACQLLIFTCQRVKKTSQCAKRRASISTWRTNMLNGVPIFQFGVPTRQRACQFLKHSSYEMLREISILNYYNKKLYIILDIILIHIMCIYVSYIKIVLYYTFWNFLLFR